MKTERIEIRIPEELKARYSTHAAARGVGLGSWMLNAAAEQYDREGTKHTRKIRKRDLAVVGEESYLGNEGHSTRDLGELVGQEYYLVQTDYVLGQGHDHWTLQAEPACGNMSGAPTIRGWCGTTDDVSRYAEGRVVVLGQSRTHIHLGTLLPDAE
jgi:hypothetical protein